MGNKFTTEVVSLASLNEYDFSIPTYQRPYVWGDEQIKKLLDDFYITFSNDKETIYYLSTILTQEEYKHAELIDGQQRFTTLWLISFVVSKLCPNSKISGFLKKDAQLRIGFEIRMEVSEFLESLLDDETVSKKIYDNQFIIDYPYLKNIAKALVFIDGYLRQMPQEKIEPFGNFIYTNVQLIKNKTAKNTDLNKLFSIINSAGVQLEQTDIVKANLLKLIDYKVLYGKIWEACENMNNFFERNARMAFVASDWKNINLENLISFDRSIFKHAEEDNKNQLADHIFNIDDLDLNNISPYKFPDKTPTIENRESDEIFCRSIISFSQLLLHTYRLHLKREGKADFEGTFHVSRLIEIFASLEERRDSEEIKRFFNLLWEVRFLFDKYIIKWISDVDSKSESLELVNLNRNQESYYSRPKYEKSASLMLQCVLYFTGDYLRQYWLTTYLGYLLNNHNNLTATSNSHLSFLETIDNIFSTTENIGDKELSWILLETQMVPNFDKTIDLKEYLTKQLGTKFKHYWFQKLEYILWKHWDEERTKEFENFRIMSRNSVEHIYPQNPENLIKNPPIGEDLHSFGNLVLLSVNQNSEYSRKSFHEKRGFFNDKNVYDTLKSYYIFTKNKDWGVKQIQDHLELMIGKIESHYNNIK